MNNRSLAKQIKTTYEANLTPEDVEWKLNRAFDVLFERVMKNEGMVKRLNTDSKEIIKLEQKVKKIDVRKDYEDANFTNN